MEIEGYSDSDLMNPTEIEKECYIHDEIEAKDSNKIRKNVCFNEAPLIKHTDNEQYCIFHLPSKDKDKKTFEGTSGNEKGVNFTDALNYRLNFFEIKLDEIEKLTGYEQEEIKKDFYYDFRYVWFPSKLPLRRHRFRANVDFESATFSSVADFKGAKFTGDANFSYATFCGKAHFGRAVFEKEAYFRSARFQEEAEFTKARFSNTERAYFKKANFSKDCFFDETQFYNSVSFNSAIFGKDSDIIIRDALFEKSVDFQYCSAEGYLRFSNLKQGNENSFDFREAAFENAVRVSFHSMRLHPYWLIGCDCSKFVFSACRWKNFEEKSLRAAAELKVIEKVDHSHSLLAKTCWQLADNYEEIKNFTRASKFRRMALDTEWLERKKIILNWWNEELTFSEFLFKFGEKIKNPPYDFLHSAYRWTSAYGESWGRAAWVLVGIWLFFSSCYWLFGEFGTEKNVEYLSFGKSVGYSLFVMILQKPDPRPLSTLTYLIYGLETILAPLQAALLALAIRRKFMR